MKTGYTTGTVMQAIRDVTEAYWHETGQDLYWQRPGNYGILEEDVLRWLGADSSETWPAEELPGVLADWVSVLIEGDQTAPDCDDPGRYAVSQQWVDDTVTEAVFRASSVDTVLGNSMNTLSLGPLQKDMLRYVLKYGSDGRRFYIQQDRDSRRVATSLERRGILAVNRDFECWTVRLMRPADELPGILADWVSVLIEGDQTAPDCDDPGRYAVSRQWVDDTVAEAVNSLQTQRQRVQS